MYSKMPTEFFFQALDGQLTGEYKKDGIVYSILEGVTNQKSQIITNFCI